MSAVLDYIPGTKDYRDRLPKNPRKTYATRPLSDIQKIAVHHSLTTSGSAESFARYHIRQHDWPGIGYHFVIEKDGMVKWCNSLTVKSYHVGKSNSLAVGICLVGDFRTQRLEDIQLTPLMKLLSFLMRELNLFAGDVLGHNEFPDYAWKACPCIDMQSVRDNLMVKPAQSCRVPVEEELSDMLSPDLFLDPNRLTTRPGESVIAAAGRVGLFDIGDIKTLNKTTDLKKPSKEPVSVNVKGQEEILPDGVGKLIRTLENLGHKVYKNETKPYNLNIVGIRSRNTTPNAFDDEIQVFWKFRNTWNVRKYKITTDPGLTWLLNPLNEAGTAILKKGQYPATFRIGLHKGKYTALVQAKPVTVVRDFNRDSTLDFDSGKEQTGFFGINIHRSSATGESVLVDRWSAGCQVFANISEFNEFMGLCKQASTEWSGQFTYTLIDRNDLA